MRAISANFGHFWAVPRTHRGVGGQERAYCHGAIKAHVKCMKSFPSFVCFDWISQPIWAKKGCFRVRNVQFWEGTSQLGAPTPARHRWVFGSKLGFRKGHLGYERARLEYSPKRWNGVMAKTERRSVACLLWLACLLLARFKGRGV